MTNKPLIQRFNEKWFPEPFSGCWLWTAATSPIGYGEFRLKRMIPAHRAAWILFKGPIPNEMDVLHKCDVRSCVNPDHLFLGTHQENMKDRDAKGRKAIGEKNGKSKVTRAQVLEIRSSPETIKKLASRFNLGISTVGHIKNRTRWNWV